MDPIIYQDFLSNSKFIGNTKATGKIHNPDEAIKAVSRKERWSSGGSRSIKKMCQVRNNPVLIVEFGLRFEENTIFFF